MKIFLALSSILLCAVIGSSCIGPVAAEFKWAQHKFEHPNPNEKSITLEKSQTIYPSRLGVKYRVSLPQGVYKPEFKTENGVFYRSPIPLIIEILGLNTVHYGGIYIPNEKDKNQKHGMYYFPGPGLQGINRLGTNKIEFKYID